MEGVPEELPQPIEGVLGKSWFKDVAATLRDKSGFSEAPSLANMILLASGSRNVYFRLIFKKPITKKTERGIKSYQTVIFKCPKGYNPSDPPGPKDFIGQHVEIGALTLLPDVRTRLWPSIVQVPEIWEFDFDKAFVIMDDVCPPDLGPEPKTSTFSYCTLRDWCLEPSEGAGYQTVALTSRDGAIADAIGEALGSFLARLHFNGGPTMWLKKDELSDEGVLQTIFKNRRKWIVATTIHNFFENLHQLQVILTPERHALFRAIINDMRQEVLKRAKNLSKGNFLFSKIRLSLTNAGSPGPAMRSLHVLDWEYTTYASPWVDLGHFLGEAWLHEQIHEQNRGNSNEPLTLTKLQRVAGSMLSAYCSRQLGEMFDMQKTIYFMAIQVCSSLVHEKMSTVDFHVRRRVGVYAVEMMDAAAKGDMELLHIFKDLANRIEEHNGARVTRYLDG